MNGVRVKKTCKVCGEAKDEVKFKKLDSGNRGQTCNSCLWDARKDRDRVPAAAKAATGGVQDEDDKKYWFDKDREIYVFTDARITLPKDVVETILDDYSWINGKGLTLNEVARKHGLSRSTVREIIKACGKTHDSLGYSDETIAEADEDFLLEDQVRKKEQRIIVRAEKERWEKIKKMAEKAERWEAFVFSRIEAMAIPEIPAPKKLKAVEKDQGDLLTYMGIQDVHLGKQGLEEDVGPENVYNSKICRERLLDTIASSVARVRRFGELNQILLPCGGDFFHIDTPGKTTTKGTPQDTDGSLAKIMVDGFALAAEMVNYLAQAAGLVTIVNSAGNHDNTLSLVLLKWLEVAFKNRPDVQVIPSLFPRQYVQFGQNLIGVTHGDGPKDAKLPMLMATEAPKAWADTKFRYWFSGHYHTQFANEFFGVQVHHHDSVAGSDRWHVNNGYVGNVKGMNVYVLDKEDGMIAHMPIAAKV